MFRSRNAALEAEARRLNKDLDRAHAGLRRDLEAVSGTGKPRRRSAAREDEVNGLEERLAANLEEQAALRGQAIAPDDLRAALAAFDPVWEKLTTVEQSRVVQLLIERIEYNGQNGNVDIMFRAAGVSALATEAAP